MRETSCKRSAVLNTFVCWSIGSLFVTNSSLQDRNILGLAGPRKFVVKIQVNDLDRSIVDESSFSCRVMSTWKMLRVVPRLKTNVIGFNSTIEFRRGTKVSFSRSKEKTRVQKRFAWLIRRRSLHVEVPLLRSNRSTGLEQFPVDPRRRRRFWQIDSLVFVSVDFDSTWFLVQAKTQSLWSTAKPPTISTRVIFEVRSRWFKRSPFVWVLTIVGSCANSWISVRSTLHSVFSD